jgi:hypothetical protein
MNNYTLLVLLIVSTASYGQPGCRQVGTRLKDFNDAKGLCYVSCSCPCNEYEQLARGGQCAECKHYPEPGQNELVLYRPDIHEAHRQYLEDIEE